MVMLKPEDQPECAKYDPELWFPDGMLLRSHASDGKFFADAITAMEICTECPLYANGACLDYAMSDAVTIDHGIYAATLPHERRIAVGVTPFEKREEPWQYRIRERATKYGIPISVIPPRERPERLHVTYLTPVKNTSEDAG